ncbi:MarR family winged helix-turn-helix transcriptional regulator [Burkholderia sp. L27(2015)]|uniref:MarR family winged helix-turn-helix transcriptional regulator n=1 Tax=Burkholderia sp. L27(2015) TaxID=1641858 RepID=UPI00131B2F05|nr:MarR family transcriptional regulator [Burkholderia sp. L27(2015)]
MRNQKTSLQSLPTLDIHLGYWLRLVSNRVSGNFARALQERNVSLAEWVALNQIQRWADMTPAKLADAMSMTRGAISKVLDKLQEKKWISRMTSEEDNRVQFLSLTSKGGRVLPDLAAIADENDEHFFGALDPAEQTTLRFLLSKLADIHRISNVPVD